MSTSYRSLYLLCCDGIAQTGLTMQQIRSQIADNRNNLRRQLMERCKTLN
jgi:hypothetical protein